MAGRLYILVGAPWSGKTKLIKFIRCGKIPNFKAEIITKVSNRRKRPDEGSEIKPVDNVTRITLTPTEKLISFCSNNSKYYEWNDKSNELILNGPLPFDELQKLYECIDDNRNDKESLEKLNRMSNEIGESCDIIYEQYTKRYGFEIQPVIESLNKGNSAIIIINDIRAIRTVKSILGSFVITIFLYRPIPQNYLDIQAKRGLDIQAKRDADCSTDSDDYRQTIRRLEKTKLIQRRYFENIELFDHLILNTEENNFQDLIDQMAGIVSYYQNKDIPKFVTKEGLYA